MDNNRPTCSGGCCCKVAGILSALALIVSLGAYFFPKSGSPVDSSTFDEKVKGIIIDTVKQNPQLLMNAMSDGIAKQREEELQQVEKAVAEKKAEIAKQAQKFGKLEAKTSVICFFDPLEKSCIELQKVMLTIVKAKKDVCFKLIPVAVLGDDSVTLAKVYIAVYEKSPEKAVTFIEHITSGKGDMDKAAIDDALKVAGLNSKEIEGMMDDCDKKLAENGKLAESLKIPVVPALFLTQGSEVGMLRLSSADQLLPAIESKLK